MKIIIKDDNECYGKIDIKTNDINVAIGVLLKMKLDREKETISRKKTSDAPQKRAYHSSGSSSPSINSGGSPSISSDNPFSATKIEEKVEIKTKKRGRKKGAVGISKPKWTIDEDRMLVKFLTKKTKWFMKNTDISRRHTSAAISTRLWAIRGKHFNRLGKDAKRIRKFLLTERQLQKREQE